MNKLIVTAALAMIASNASAQVDPVVAEYKELAALQMTAPTVFNSIVTVNALSAYECNKVVSKNALFNSKEFANLFSYVTEHGQDGSKTYVSTLKEAVSGVCNGTLTSDAKQESDLLNAFQESALDLQTK